MKTIDWPEVIKKFDVYVARGFCNGKGNPNGKVCVEAAITLALGLPFSDNPECVAPAVRSYKIRLNDAYGWASDASRAVALRSIGIAQIGSKGVVDDVEFAKRLAEKTIRVLIPNLFRLVLAKYPDCLKAADKCEAEGTEEAAREAQKSAAAYAAVAYAAAYAVAYAAADAAAAYAAAYAAADAAAYAAAADAATAAATAATAAAPDREQWLRLSAELALEVLRELKSPGCEWL